MCEEANISTLIEVYARKNAVPAVSVQIREGWKCNQLADGNNQVDYHDSYKLSAQVATGKQKRRCSQQQKGTGSLAVVLFPSLSIYLNNGFTLILLQNYYFFSWQFIIINNRKLHIQLQNSVFVSMGSESLHTVINIWLFVITLTGGVDEYVMRLKLPISPQNGLLLPCPPALNLIPES